MPAKAHEVRVEQLWIPDSLDGPEAADFLAAVEVGRKVRMQTWGSDDLAYAPLEKLLEMADPYERQVILVAKVDDVIVGTVDIALPLADNTRTSPSSPWTSCRNSRAAASAGSCWRPPSTWPGTKAGAPS